MAVASTSLDVYAAVTSRYVEPGAEVLYAHDPSVTPAM
jgi:hypothetical protein